MNEHIQIEISTKQLEMILNSISKLPLEVGVETFNTIRNQADKSLRPKAGPSVQSDSNFRLIEDSKLIFLEQENFLSDEDCDLLIRMHDEFYDKLGTTWFDNIKPLCLDTMFKYTLVTEGPAYDIRFDYLKRLVAKMNHYIHKVNKDAYVDFSQIVEWPCGTGQPRHFDREYNLYTSIVYLNDDFNGGETFVDYPDKTVVIKPKRGKIITFNSNKLVHGVKQVQPLLDFIERKRYTYAVWYKAMNLTV